MTIRFFCLGLLLFLLTACAAGESRRLPEFASQTTQALNPAQKKSCAAVYPEGKWQFIHAIEFTLADGTGSTVVGVTVLDGSTISSALMTIEGLTLFAARFTDRLEVLRAVPPFDKPSFADGLMNDVRAIFIHPSAKDIQYGYLPDNTLCCRITIGDGQITDVMPSDTGCWQINTYSPELIRTRTIIARSCTTVDSNRIPEKLELTVPGPTGYTLKMNLMSAEQMSPTTPTHTKNATP